MLDYNLVTVRDISVDTLRLTFILFTLNRKPRFAVSGFMFAVLANMKLRLTFFFAFIFFRRNYRIHLNCAILPKKQMSLPIC